jgi:hypothetical protein
MEMENGTYTEWVPTGLIVKSLFTMIVLIVVLVTFAVFIFSKASLIENILSVSIGWVALAILLLVLYNYRGIQIRISNQHLLVEYGRFDKKSILLNEIVSCKQTKAFRRYLGIGVRIGLDGSLAYTTSFSTAVEVTPKVGRVFVFSTNAPKQICEIINQRKNF